MTSECDGVSGRGARWLVLEAIGDARQNEEEHHCVEDGVGHNGWADATQ
jgi:hypothetical protein